MKTVCIPEVGDKVILRRNVVNGGTTVPSGTKGTVEVANGWTVCVRLESPIKNESMDIELIHWRPDADNVREGSNFLFEMLERLTEDLDFQTST